MLNAAEAIALRDKTNPIHNLITYSDNALRSLIQRDRDSGEPIEGYDIETLIEHPFVSFDQSHINALAKHYEEQGFTVVPRPRKFPNGFDSFVVSF